MQIIIGIIIGAIVTALGGLFAFAKAFDRMWG